MDFSIAFETLNYDLLIAGLRACGFTKELIKLIKSIR